MHNRKKKIIQIKTNYKNTKMYKRKKAKKQLEKFKKKGN